MSRSPTPKQLDVLRVMLEYQDRVGVTPTLQEMAQIMGLSKPTLYERVEALIEKGILVRIPNVARGLSLAPGYEPPFDRFDRISTLERECIVLARYAASMYTDKASLLAAHEILKKWLLVADKREKPNEQV